MAPDIRLRIEYDVSLDRLAEIEQDVKWVANQPPAHTHTNLLSITAFILVDRKRYQVGELVSSPRGGLQVGLREYESREGSLQLTKSHDYYP